MEQKESAWYLLFESLTQGLLLDEMLREAGFHGTIVPMPRHLGTGCGAALALQADEVDDVRALVRHEGAGILEASSRGRDVNTRRDRYC